MKQLFKNIRSESLSLSKISLFWKKKTQLQSTESENSSANIPAFSLWASQQLFFPRHKPLNPRQPLSHFCPTCVTCVVKVQRPILTIHPSEGRALTVSRPAERRPMSRGGGSLGPGQAEAGCVEEQGHCSRSELFAGGPPGRLLGPTAPGDNPLMPVTMRFDWRPEPAD